MSTHRPVRGCARARGGSSLQRSGQDATSEVITRATAPPIRAKPLAQQTHRPAPRAAYLLPLSAGHARTTSRREAIPRPRPRGEPLVPLLRAEQALGDPGRARHLARGALERPLDRGSPRPAGALALSLRTAGRCCWVPRRWRRTSWPVPLPAPAGRPGPGGACWRTSCATPATRSVACLPIRSGRRDVGLLLAATCSPVALRRERAHGAGGGGAAARADARADGAAVEQRRRAARSSRGGRRWSIGGAPARHGGCRSSTSPSSAARSSRCCRTTISSCCVADADGRPDLPAGRARGRAALGRSRRS